MSARRALAMVLAVVTGGSCSLIEAYPELELEEDTLCADGVDNDFDGDLDCEDASCAASVLCHEADQACGDGADNDRDGLTDCADPGCDGVCPERGAGACRDERDNDGDGLWDTADPGCFFAGASSVGEERCASARETQWTARELLAGALGVRDVSLFPRDGVVAELGPAALLIGSASSTGAIEGLELSLDVRGDPGVMRYVQLVEPSTGAEGAAQGLSIGTDGGGTIQLRSGDRTLRAHASPPVSTIVARVTDRTLRVVSPDTLLDEAGEPTELAVELPALLRDGAPLSIRIRGELATNDGSPWLEIRSLTLRRPSFRPCGEDNPSLIVPEESEALAATYDGTQDLLCALVVEGRGPTTPGTLVTYVSDDQGAQWSRAVALEATAARAALAWDPAAERFVALLSGEELTAWASRDCITWSPTDAPAVPIEAPSALGYEVSRDGSHRLAAIMGAEVVAWQSPNGSSNSFVETHRLVPDESVGFDDVHQVLPMAGHVLLVHAPPGSLGLGFAVDQPDGALRDSGLRFLAGTGVLGSVDRAGVQWARLVLRPPGSGTALRFTVLYGGVEGAAMGGLDDHVATANLVVQ